MGSRLHALRPHTSAHLSTPEQGTRDTAQAAEGHNPEANPSCAVSQHQLSFNLTRHACHAAAVCCRLDVDQHKDVRQDEFVEKYTSLVQRLSLLLLQVRACMLCQLVDAGICPCPTCCTAACQPALECTCNLQGLLATNPGSQRHVWWDTRVQPAMPDTPCLTLSVSTHTCLPMYTTCSHTCTACLLLPGNRRQPAGWPDHHHGRPQAAAAGHAALEPHHFHAGVTVVCWRCCLRHLQPRGLDTSHQPLTDTHLRQ